MNSLRGYERKVGQAERFAVAGRSVGLRIRPEIQEWIEARKRHHLSHAHVQMARELGMNPKKLGKLDNHRQERWKAPLPLFIEELYEKRFGRTRPQVVMSIEDRARADEEKRASKRAAQAERRQATTQTSDVRSGEVF